MGTKTGSGEKRRRNHPSIRPRCWTQFLRDHDTYHDTILDPVPRKVLCQRDYTGYTIVHAMCSSLLELNVIRSEFQVLDKLQLMGKITAKDKDGDMPLQSAVISKADVPTAELILNYLPERKVAMLENRNNANETALEQSLLSENTDLFKYLLRECIKCEVLPDLTCTGTANRQCNTLVHKCIIERRITCFCAFLEVCKECGVRPDLCIGDEKGYTPWQYLLWYSINEVPLVKEVLSVLEKHEIPISSLLVNKTTKETMLHKAYRNVNEELKDLLGKYESCRVKLDGFKRMPTQRNRILRNTNRGHMTPRSHPPQPSQARPQPTTQRPPQPSQARPQDTMQRPPQPSQARPQPTTQRPPQPSQARLQDATKRPAQPLQTGPQECARFLGDDRIETQPHSKDPDWTPGRLKHSLPKPDPPDIHPIPHEPPHNLLTAPPFKTFQ